MSDAKVWGLGSDYKPVSNKPDEFRFCCHFCPTKGKGEDTGYHLYVNVSKRVFNCYRCSSRGGLSKLGGKFAVGNMRATQKLDVLKGKINSLFALKPTPHFDLDEISWPILDSDATIGYEYMKERGFSDDEMIRYQLRVGKSYFDEKLDRKVHKWSGRILFPFIENGEVVFIVGRSYSGREPRYVNSDGSKDHVVYGIDDIRDGQCLLCEGIISKIAAERVTGFPAVAILGKSATRYQLSKLRGKVHTVYTCLDGTSDVTDRDRAKLNRSLLRIGITVYEVRPPSGKDPDDAGADFLQCFQNAKRVKL
jgi:hypothetical protein